MGLFKDTHFDKFVPTEETGQPNYRVKLVNQMLLTRSTQLSQDSLPALNTINKQLNQLGPANDWFHDKKNV